MTLANIKLANIKFALIPLALASALVAGAVTPALAAAKAVGGAGGVKDVGGTLVPLSSYGLI